MTGWTSRVSQAHHTWLNSTFCTLKSLLLFPLPWQWHLPPPETRASSLAPIPHSHLWPSSGIVGPEDGWNLFLWHCRHPCRRHSQTPLYLLRLLSHLLLPPHHTSEGCIQTAISTVRIECELLPARPAGPQPQCVPAPHVLCLSLAGPPSPLPCAVLLRLYPHLPSSSLLRSHINATTQGYPS